MSAATFSSKACQLSYDVMFQKPQNVAIHRFDEMGFFFEQCNWFQYSHAFLVRVTTLPDHLHKETLRQKFCC